MQVAGLTWVQVLRLKYLRTNTYVENTSMQYEQGTMVYVTSSNQWVETCDKLKFTWAFLQTLENLASLLENCQLLLASALLTSTNVYLSGTVSHYQVRMHMYTYTLHTYKYIYITTLMCSIMLHTLLILLTLALASLIK